jgi:glutamine amidotransferase
MNNRIGLIRLPIGNLQSAWNAVYQLGFDPVFLGPDDGDDDVSHLIVPGDGNFRAVMMHLDAVGVSDRIRRFAASGRPTLGICVGMQILATQGNESGDTAGLGLIDGVVKKMEPSNLRLPHIGWNTLHIRRQHAVFDGIKADRDMYFVHSYAFAPTHSEDCLATTDYGIEFASIVGRGNVLGFQFHPEKSQSNGLKLIENFLHWDGTC